MPWYRPVGHEVFNGVLCTERPGAAYKETRFQLYITQNMGDQFFRNRAYKNTFTFTHQ